MVYPVVGVFRLCPTSLAHQHAAPGGFLWLKLFCLTPEAQEGVHVQFLSLSNGQRHNTSKTCSTNKSLHGCSVFLTLIDVLICRKPRHQMTQDSSTNGVHTVTHSVSHTASARASNAESALRRGMPCKLAANGREEHANLRDSNIAIQETLAASEARTQSSLGLRYAPVGIRGLPIS